MRPSTRKDFMQLNPTLLTFLAGSVIPFVTAFFVHRDAKAGWWPGVKAALSLVAGVAITLSQGGGVISRQTVLTALFAYVAAHVADWGVLHQTSIWSKVLGLLGGFGLGKPPLATGGVVNQDQAGIVGEKGPEFIQPKSWTLHWGGWLKPLEDELSRADLGQLVTAVRNELAKRGVALSDLTQDFFASSTHAGVTVHNSDGTPLLDAPVPHAPPEVTINADTSQAQQTLSDLLGFPLPVSAEPDNAAPAAVPANADTPAPAVDTVVAPVESH